MRSPDRYCLLGNLRAISRIRTKLGQVEKRTKHMIQRTLLDLTTSLPARKGCFGYVKIAGELLLGQAQSLTLLAYLFRLQKTSYPPQFGADGSIPDVVDDREPARRATMQFEFRETNSVRASVVFDIRLVGILRRKNGLGATLGAFPRMGFRLTHDLLPMGIEYQNAGTFWVRIV